MAAASNISMKNKRLAFLKRRAKGHRREEDVPEELKCGNDSGENNNLVKPSGDTEQGRVLDDDIGDVSIECSVTRSSDGKDDTEMADKTAHASKSIHKSRRDAVNEPPSLSSVKINYTVTRSEDVQDQISNDEQPITESKFRLRGYRRYRKQHARSPKQMAIAKADSGENISNASLLTPTYNPICLPTPKNDFGVKQPLPTPQGDSSCEKISVSAMLNDFSFGFKQMLENSYSSDDKSLRDTGSPMYAEPLPTMEAPNNEDMFSAPIEEDFDVVPQFSGDLVVDRSSIRIAGALLKFDEPKSSSEHHVAKSKRLSNTRSNRNRIGNMISESRCNSEDIMFPAFEDDTNGLNYNKGKDAYKTGAKRFVMSMASGVKGSKSKHRTRSTSICSTSSHSSDNEFFSASKDGRPNSSINYRKKLTMSIGNSLKRLNRSRSSSVSSAQSRGTINNSVPSLLNDNESLPQLEDDENSHVLESDYVTTSFEHSDELDESDSSSSSSSSHSLVLPEDESYDSTDSSYSSGDTGSSALDESADTYADHKRMLKLRIGFRDRRGSEKGGKKLSSSENYNPNIMMGVNCDGAKRNGKNGGMSSPGVDTMGLELVANQGLLNKYSESVLREC